MAEELTDSEEEILVYAEFEDTVNIEKYRAIHVLGVNGKNPVIQMDDTFFTGKHENALGTYMFFEEDPEPKSEDPLFDKLPEKNLKYLCKTKKLLNMEHAYVTPKEGHDLLHKKPEADDNIEPVNFKSMSKMTNTGRGRRHGRQVKTVEEIFQRVNRRYVRIKRKDRTDNNSILYKVLRALLKIMRECDNLFDSMNPKLEYLGSYFDGMRVGQPNEYDINVILTIHINYNKICLDARETQNSYTSIIMPEEFRRLSNTPETATKGFQKTKFWCDKSHRLLVTSFRSWMQGVVDTALKTLPLVDGKLKADIHYVQLIEIV
ncbi:hypothetical protein PYW08_013900 [Mythimna loreyi]|uniref:Uncharacterized protein n=1 Tax=Mythimna loreyi TaxID=667449 RepID=A0ACC2R6I7_9NEOP|nr:hypothetical protein PYW08_013900 [Mythimna loreyi]